MKSRAIKNRGNFYVCENEKEFLDFHNGNPPPLVPWRDGKPGDWVLAEDGGYVQILSRGLLKFSKWDGVKRWNVNYVRTIVGSFLCVPESVMDTDFNKHKNSTGMFDRKRPKKPLQRKDELVLTQILVGVDPHEAFRRMYPTCNNARKERMKLEAILKYGKVLEKAMDKAVKDAAGKLGINAEFVMKNMKSLAQSAEKENVKLGANIELGKIVELYPKTSQQPDPWDRGAMERISASEVAQAEVLPEHPKELTQ